MAKRRATSGALLGSSDETGLRETRVTENIEIAAGVFLLKYPRERDFLPGQVVGITVDRRIAPRYYSISSGKDEEFVDLLYDVVPGGELTPLLAALRGGDLLFVSPPSGAFLDGDEEGWWIATGTGIAPFVSMAKSGLGGRKRLVHGSRLASGLYYRKYFAAILKERYVSCCTKETGDGIFSGRLTAWLGQKEGLPTSGRFLLCGSAEMVVDVRDLLIARGVPFGNISSEIYF